MSDYDPYSSSYDRSVGGGSSGMSKNTKLYVIGGGVGAIAIWYFYQKRKTAAATAAVTDTSSSDGTDTTSTDTGYSPALTSYTDPATGQVISGGGWMSGGYPLPGTTITAPGTNAQWAQQAIAYLSQEGFDSVAVTVAVGKYLAGTNLTNTELEMVQSAIGAEGYPPTPPAPPHVAPPSGQGGGTTGTVGNPSAPTGLHIVSHTKGTAVLGWHPDPRATGYLVFYRGLPHARVTRANATVHLNGVYEIAAQKGRFISAQTAITVKGI